MKKLKNTPTNKALLLFGCVGGFALLGRFVARQPDKKVFTIAGAVVGLMVLGGITSLVMEPKNQK